MTITTATATRQGTEANNADSAAVFTSETGLTAAALIDIAGHHERAPQVAWLLAETAARVGAQLGGRAALLSAGLLVRDPGADDEPEPTGVGVVATVEPGDRAMISWTGDSHAYGWDGTRLHRYTTPHTLAEQMRQHDIAVGDIANDWIMTSLAEATPASICSVTCPVPLIILTSDGLDALPHDDLVTHIREHADQPQALADALVAAVPDSPHGTRDDATVIVIRTT